MSDNESETESESNSESDKQYQLDCRLNELELTVKGPDPHWVVDEFERQWRARLDESSEMKDAIRRSDRSAQ